MYTIDLEFKNLKDVALKDWQNVYGVYILWGPRSLQVPAYIGQGIIATRLSAHRNKWMTAGFSGIIASTSTDVLPTPIANKDKAKHDAKLSEAFLLWAAKKLNYWPSRNRSIKEVNRLLSKSYDHGVLKFNIMNYHPFMNPLDIRCHLDRPVSLKVRFDKQDPRESTLENCPWPRRSISNHGFRNESALGRQHQSKFQGEWEKPSE